MRIDDSKHAAGVCLGTIQARTLAQLALACQQSMLRVQHRLRPTMQHVYGNPGNLGNECADHAAALGTFGLVSNHNPSTRWIRRNFDTSACFGSCNNVGEVLENCVTSELKQHRYLRTGVSAVFSIGLCMTFTHALRHTLFVLSPFPTRTLFQCLVVPQLNIFHPDTNTRTRLVNRALTYTTRVRNNGSQVYVGNWNHRAEPDLVLRRAPTLTDEQRQQRVGSRALSVQALAAGETSGKLRARPTAV